MPQISIQYFETEVGELVAGAVEGRLCLLDYRHRKGRSLIDNRIRKATGAEFIEQGDEVLSRTRAQLDEYLRGERTRFDIPLLLAGTAFQKSVWLRLQQIPYGTTLTYLQLARKMGRENAVRAVAAANGANAISIIIPCHRVVGSGGALTGYAGGLAAKGKLLALEAGR